MVMLITFVFCLVIPIVAIVCLRNKIPPLLIKLGNTSVIVSILSIIILLVPFFLSIWYDKLDFSATFSGLDQSAFERKEISKSIEAIQQGTKGTELEPRLVYVEGWVSGVLDIQDSGATAEYGLIGFVTGLWVALVLLNWRLTFEVSRKEDDYDNMKQRLNHYRRALTILREPIYLKRSRIVEANASAIPPTNGKRMCSVCLDMINPNGQIEIIMNELLVAFKKTDKLDNHASLRIALYRMNENALDLAYCIDALGDKQCITSYFEKYRERFSLGSQKRCLAVKLYCKDGITTNFVVLKNLKELSKSDLFEYFDKGQEGRIKSLAGLRIAITAGVHKNNYGVVLLDSDTDDYFDDDDKMLIAALQPEISLRLGLEMEYQAYLDRLMKEVV
jgi:hypothetical protein